MAAAIRHSALAVSRGAAAQAMRPSAAALLNDHLPHPMCALELDAAIACAVVADVIFVVARRADGGAS